MDADVQLCERHQRAYALVDATRDMERRFCGKKTQEATRRCTRVYPAGGIWVQHAQPTPRSLLHSIAGGVRLCVYGDPHERLGATILCRHTIVYR